MHYLGFDFKRFSSDEIIRNFDIFLSNDTSKDNIELNYSNVDTLKGGCRTKMWYRRGNFSFEIPFQYESAHEKLAKCLNDELDIIRYFLHDYLSVLGSFQKEKYSNKISDLYMAREIGINIPDTLITTAKTELLSFYSKNKKVITKPIHNGHLGFASDGKKYSSKGVLIVTEDIITNLQDRFCPSLFQKYIDKEYEIRVFFIEDQLYPMAIFSQLDSKTMYDYRNYNREKPNRNVPYNLPEKIKSMLVDFIFKSKLDTGSIDLIYSGDKDYVFLETNPAGQFGWVSSNCNYYLEREVAKHLINFQNGQ